MIIIILIRDNLIYDIIYTGFVSEVRDLRIVNNIEASSLYCDSVIVVLLWWTSASVPLPPATDNLDDQASPQGVFQRHPQS